MCVPETTLFHMQEHFQFQRLPLTVVLRAKMSHHVLDRDLLSSQTTHRPINLRFS